jgi:murein DD-endopeptidase MepM/ murein hydrolase activator NlpD
LPRRRCKSWLATESGRRTLIAALAIGLLLPVELVHTPGPAVASAAGRADMLSASRTLPAAEAVLRASAAARVSPFAASRASDRPSQLSQTLQVPTDSEGGSTAGLPVTDYTVQPGDSLTSIAGRFGTDVRSLEASNQLTDSSILQPGQHLVVPTQVGWVYSVSAGDTLEQIAAQTGVSASVIAGANHVTGNSILQIGERLWIPHEPPVSAYTAGSSGGGSGDSSSGSSSTSGSGGLYGMPWPVTGPITSPFGWRILYGRRDFHDGIDIGVPMYTPVHASITGTVITAGWDGPYGIAVRIQAGDVITMYAHNSRLVVSVGEHVNVGQLISYSGMTGNATGPHVHFGIYINGQPVNPLTYLR